MMIRWIALVLLLIAAPVFAQGEQKFAELGDFKLESGEIIQQCRLGYRTFGTLNADKSNAILFPTWFSGKTEHLVGNFGSGKLVDTDRYFVIAVDAIGNGVSSSPSNSATQPNEKFPRFTIRDIVNSQYQLVTKTFGIKQLHAVMGISMGGMQTFEWMVAWPEMMHKAIPIVGTTIQTAYDLLLWETELRAIEAARKAGTNDIDVPMAARAVARIHALALVTPRYRNAQTAPQAYAKFVTTEEENYARTFKPYDWASQLRAMMAHDVSKTFNGDMEKAAAAVKAKTLVIIATQDHMVNPDPALAFAKLLVAPVIELTGDCGHLATACESKTVSEAVRRFLNQH